MELEWYKDTFECNPEKDGIDDSVTNIIEIAKDREFGTQDVFIPLYFEESTKRLKNYPEEFVMYKWDIKENVDFTTDLPDDIPF